MDPRSERGAVPLTERVKSVRDTHSFGPAGSQLVFHMFLGALDPVSELFFEKLGTAPL